MLLITEEEIAKKYTKGLFEESLLVISQHTSPNFWYLSKLVLKFSLGDEW